MDLLKDSLKPHVFMFGACDLGFALEADVIKKDFIINRVHINRYRHDNLDFTKGWVPNYATSLLSLYTPPNEIANRVHESLATYKNLKPHHYEFNREIVKYPYLKYYKTHAGPNDIFVMNFSTELYTKMSVKSEIFTLLPNLGNPNLAPINSEDPLHWLYKEYLSNEQYQHPFDTDYALNSTYDVIRDFVKDIYEIFKNRVVLVKTHLSDLTFDGAVIRKAPLDANVSYKQSRIMQNVIDHNYAARVSNIFAKKFQTWYPCDIPVVSIDDTLFLDPNHPQGYAPYHLHSWSAHKIGAAIYKELVKINDNTKKQISNIILTEGNIL